MCNLKKNKNNIQSVVCLQVVFIKLNGTKSDIRSDVENKIINKKVIWLCQVYYCDFRLKIKMYLKIIKK